MPNKIADHKKRYSFIFEKKLIAMVDNECQRTNLNRTEVIRKAIREHLALEPINYCRCDCSNNIKNLKKQIKDLKKIIKLDKKALDKSTKVLEKFIKFMKEKYDYS